MDIVEKIIQQAQKQVENGSMFTVGKSIIVNVNGPGARVEAGTDWREVLASVTTVAHGAAAASGFEPGKPIITYVVDADDKLYMLLSILGSGELTDKDYITKKRAAALLNEMFEFDGGDAKNTEIMRWAERNVGSTGMAALHDAPDWLRAVLKFALHIAYSLEEGGYYAILNIFFDALRNGNLEEVEDGLRMAAMIEKAARGDDDEGKAADFFSAGGDKLKA